MKKLLLIAFLSLISVYADASLISIIDSGVDMLHESIKDAAWTNSKEIPMNRKDDDRNGYKDDYFGWNFVRNNNQVIDYRYLGLLDKDTRRFFEIQTKEIRDEATQEEKDWVKTMMKKKVFLKRLITYANFMHGTHVAGIAAKGNPGVKVMAVKVIPTEIRFLNHLINDLKNVEDKGLITFLLKQALSFVAKLQVKSMVKVAKYIDGHQVKIANASFAIPYNMTVTRMKRLLKGFLSESDIKDVVADYINTLGREGVEIVKAAPNTLFVFAAGNESLDNSQLPTFPANIKAPNVIVVGASVGLGKLAKFSNFGREVHLAAPGVGIESSVPGNQYLALSGTSQAAPYVAGIAGSMALLNPALTPEQLKTIIVDTVDKVEGLVGQVSSEGVINGERAKEAARLSQQTGVQPAIAIAIDAIPDKLAEDYLLAPAIDEENLWVNPLPNPFPIK